MNKITKLVVTAAVGLAFVSYKSHASIITYNIEAIITKGNFSINVDDKITGSFTYDRNNTFTLQIGGLFNNHLLSRGINITSSVPFFSFTSFSPTVSFFDNSSPDFTTDGFTVRAASFDVVSSFFTRLTIVAEDLDGTNFSSFIAPDIIPATGWDIFTISGALGSSGSTILDWAANVTSLTFDVSEEVPEPENILLLFVGLGLLGFAKLKKTAK